MWSNLCKDKLLKQKLKNVTVLMQVMMFRVLHGLAPPYLDQLVRVDDKNNNKQTFQNAQLTD